MNKKRFIAFTLAEVLITLGIIGVVAALTIPTLIQNNQEKQMVTGLLKFNSNLQHAVQLWKMEEGCSGSAYECFVAQSTDSNLPTDYYDQFVYTIGKHMKIIQSAVTDYDVDWLPNDTKNYYGNTVASAAPSGKVSTNAAGVSGIALLQDGTTFTVIGNVSAAQAFQIWVDVNGKKGPNRIGKDTFLMTIGGAPIDYNENVGKQDLSYCQGFGTTNAQGLCDCWGDHCEPDNANPATGAMPTSYVLLNHKLPQF